MNVEVFCFDAVAPVRERGLKYRQQHNLHYGKYVAPVRERGLKYEAIAEILRTYEVAPVRERGLKSLKSKPLSSVKSRSREGAWIEMSDVYPYDRVIIGRSREGAWIEIITAPNFIGKVNGSLP